MTFDLHSALCCVLDGYTYSKGHNYHPENFSRNLSVVAATSLTATGPSCTNLVQSTCAKQPPVYSGPKRRTGSTAGHSRQVPLWYGWSPALWSKSAAWHSTYSCHVSGNV